VKVPLAEIFKTPDISGLGLYIKGADRETFFSIEPAEKKEYYELSPPQRRMYILQQMEPGNIVYNIPEIIPIGEPRIEKEHLENTLRKLVQRHESLRTSFCMQEEHPVQHIHDTGTLELEIENYDLTAGNSFETGNGEPGTPGEQGEKGGTRTPVSTIIKNFVRPFDLTQAPLIRVGLINTAVHAGETSPTQLLLVDRHHIVSDGVSRRILRRDFMRLHRNEDLPGLRIQYKDYSQWWKGERGTEKLEQQESYWLKRFEEEIPVLDLPTDYPRPVVRSFEGDMESFEISASNISELTAIAFENGTTLYMVQLTIFNVFLSKLSGREDIVVGTAVAGRRHSDLEKLIGMFVNTLPMRNYPESGKTFEQLLHDVTKTTLPAFDNQEYPFEELVDKMELNRDTSRNPLFDTMLNLDNVSDDPGGETPGDGDREPGKKDSQQDNIMPVSKFDMTLSAGKNRGILNCSLEYCTRLFKKETILRFIAYFEKILSAAVENPAIKLSQIEILSEEEKKRVLYDFNDSGTENGFTTEKTLQRLFEEQVEKTPDSAALSGIAYAQPAMPQTLTYRKLDERASAFARYLQTQGVGEGELVGLLTRRSVEMIVCIVAILKTGSAYVPLNHDAPGNRNKYMLDECRVKTLVSLGTLATQAEEIANERNLIYVDEADELTEKNLTAGTGIRTGTENRTPHPAASHAYVIFTSGSTGKPKGVPITHSNLSPLLHWGYKELGIGCGHRTLQNLSYYFDWSVWEIFITLTTGAQLYMVPEEIVMNPGGSVAY
ncbi:MAG: AMP-binding protein, partial [bacterium]|nr:AMP-binding protein [bacterium]